MWEALLEALIDTAKAIPILYLVYLIVEWLEHHGNKKFYSFMRKTKKAGPFMGAVLGTVPQCGFSSVMADLYSKRKITIGTLLAVFIATSDEALPIMLGQPSCYIQMLIIIGIKFVSAILIGFSVDLVVSLISRRRLSDYEKINQPITSNQCEHEHDGHCHEHDCCADNIFLEALKHTAWITLFIFITNIVLNEVIFFVGEQAFISALSTTGIFQPLIASVIGLIPNCVGSVIIIETFLSGGLSFAACVAGLSVSSGVGILVLIKRNKPIWQTVLIVLSTLIIGVALGYLTMLFDIII